ncbi:tyrosine-type recombinase/integrase [Rhodococcus sp. H29-C3]|uniref:tyrosine-type recombinase/integrase n=1 Tax=Rhodococcus sp. H29-C3 TaxID=3046307 RepID=UPI0024BB722E|nr:tyrosine-type recombinase/integrase [Rhodococcus sp. H29-C3]MDJ0362510.1 tyrosine-type recombinase/integrase [Rhodococcus sp. H29-C3]
MSDPSKVRITGPLDCWQDDLTAELTRLGFAPSVTARHLQLLAHLSHWMADHDVSVEGLSWPQVERFCSNRGLIGQRRVAPQSVMVLMNLLRPDCVPAKSTGLSAGIEELLNGFTTYLHEERSLADQTVEGYRYHVQVFASWYVERCGEDLNAVTIADVNQFLIGHVAVWSVGTVRAATTALRAMFRWMLYIGRLNNNLADGIVPVLSHLQAGVPRALPAEDIESLLAVEMSTRDRAIVLLFLRLGLRAGEVSSLSLDDFDWRAARVQIHGKGHDCQFMPVTVEVGEAVAEYLLEDRRVDSPYRQIFLTANAPHQPLTRVGASGVVTYLARRAGIEGRVGAHRLRHSAATAVLAGGGTLAEAGQLLRHRSAQATAIYAKTDQWALAGLVRPWPVDGTAHE